MGTDAETLVLLRLVRPAAMTVGELRKALLRFPDAAVVDVAGGFEGFVERVEPWTERRPSDEAGGLRTFPRLVVRAAGEFAGEGT